MKHYRFANPLNYIQPRTYRNGAFYRLADFTVRLIAHTENLAVVEYPGFRVADVPLSLLTYATQEQVEAHLAEIRGETVKTETSKTERFQFAVYVAILLLATVFAVKLVLLIPFTVIGAIILLLCFALVLSAF